MFRHFSLSVLLFVGAALLLVGCDSIQQSIYKNSIEKALHEDALTGKAATPEHVTSMRNVSMNDCPPDFRVAYMNHIHAWEQMAAVAQAKAQLDRDEDSSAIAGALASLFESDATPWSDHVRAEAEVNRLGSIASGDVLSTWREIETVAAKYGARVAQ